MTGFGKRLRNLRKQKNLTQQQLAVQIGVKNTMISFYEMGDRLPSPEVIIKMAAVFHVSTDYLLGLDKKESVDISDLDEDDKVIVYMLVDSLRKKGRQLGMVKK
ncbi:MAG: helix-turn-helix transcriptional regulator [Eubacterium sp.]|nr:helix-turn-helix transcriptional regulator [Eubacterium sp.]